MLILKKRLPNKNCTIKAKYSNLNKVQKPLQKFYRKKHYFTGISLNITNNFTLEEEDEEDNEW